MKLQDILGQLSTGEFSQMSFGGQGGGEFNESNYPNLVNHINLGLTTLYRRFKLKEERISVLIRPGQAMYPLQSIYAVHNKRSRETVRYIEDSEAVPFTDNIHKIYRVLTEFGVEMNLNDATDQYSCYTPNMTTLALPSELANQNPISTPYWLRVNKVQVIYQANHPQIVIPLGLFDPTRVNIELPYSHLEALLYFVASRANNPIGMSNEFHAGNNYAAKFEAACQQLEAMGMEIDTAATNTKLRQKGFV